MRSAPPASPVFAPPAADYPLRSGPSEPLRRRDIVWIAGLLLLTFLPRALAAARLGPVCDDGYFYLAVADAYDRGDLRTALWYLNVNVYPVLLAGFDRLGADPLAAAKAWGVAVSTLTVLPLFGWLRRLLDRRVAFAACGLYAVHPEFIEVSAEPIRDATFWLLAASSLYFFWRAAAERRLWLFASAGLSFALAAHTRTEGWLLALPALVWPLVRWREAAGERRRLVAGTAAAFAMTPLLVLVFNLTVLKGHDRWEWGKLEHFRLPYLWMTGATATEMPPQVRPAAVTPPSGATAAPAPRLAGVAPALAERFGQGESREDAGASSYLRSAAKALEPVPLLLMLVGSVACPRLLVRREHLVLSAICVAAVVGVWVRQSTLGEINGRYFLVCFFPASGAAGLGVLYVLSRLERGGARWLPPSRAAAAAAGVAVVIGGAHVAEAVTSDHPSRDREAAIGRRLGERLGADRRVVVLPHACRVGYYAGGRLPVVLLDDTPIESVLARHSAEVVILEHDDTPAPRCADLAARLIARGWTPLDLTGLQGADPFVVLTGPTARPAGAERLGEAGTNVR
ncbi:MAG TPA: glycosyltransferase family 39 protein [Planctomycetaceae bacterium]